MSFYTGEDLKCAILNLQGCKTDMTGPNCLDDKGALCPYICPPKHTGPPENRGPYHYHPM
jgi:hypothetical protein